MAARTVLVAGLKRLGLTLQVQNPAVIGMLGAVMEGSRRFGIPL